MYAHQPVEVGEALKAVGYALNVHADLLMGYVVIGLEPDGTLHVATNARTVNHAIGTMTSVIADLADTMLPESLWPIAP